MEYGQLRGVLVGAALCALVAGALALTGCGTNGGQAPAGSSGGTSSAQIEASAPVEAAAPEADTSAASAPVTEVDYMVLVNKQNLLPEGWDEMIESHIATMTNARDEEVEVEAKAYDAYLELKAELEAEGIYVDLDSARRSVADQVRIMNEFTEEYGEDYAKSHVAEPGTSEHHTGLALDLFLIIDDEIVDENEDMEQYPEIWEVIHSKLADHGFILRYLDGKEDITGYSPEVWHIRYLDDPAIAKEIMDAGITFEEYLGVADEAIAANAAAKAEAEAAAAAEADQVDAGYVVDYGVSELYTQEDMDAAIAAIMAEFDTWKGATMKRIAFIDDEICADNLAYCNSLRDEGDSEFTQAIVFTTDFHSPSAEDAEGTAWEPDTDYEGYTWFLARTDGADWKLLTWGY